MDPSPGGPIGAAVDVLGDRWTLLVLRDVVFEDRRFFRALLTGSPEGIASNILADRLVRLVDAGLLRRGSGARGQRIRYSLTEAGIRTVPVLCALSAWGLDWRPTDDGLRGPFELLRDRGPSAVDDLMVELRRRHLDGAAPGGERPLLDALAGEATS